MATNVRAEGRRGSGQEEYTPQVEARDIVEPVQEPAAEVEYSLDPVTYIYSESGQFPDKNATGEPPLIVLIIKPEFKAMNTMTQRMVTYDRGIEAVFNPAYTTPSVAKMLPEYMNHHRQLGVTDPAEVRRKALDSIAADIREIKRKIETSDLWIGGKVRKAEDVFRPPTGERALAGAVAAGTPPEQIAAAMTQEQLMAALKLKGIDLSKFGQTAKGAADGADHTA